LARGGHLGALAVFDEFGLRLQEVVQPFADAFGPDFILLGGGISRSHDLFSRRLGARVRQSRGSSSATLSGAAALFSKNSKEVPQGCEPHKLIP